MILLTATGGRPEAFELCVRWMNRQTTKEKVKWIIVNDVDIEDYSNIRDDWELEIINPFPRWEPGQNTQARNLLEGLNLVSETDRLFIIEDDDYYHPNYLEEANKGLDHHDLVGECQTRYYNISNNSYKICPNKQHASLCATGMKGPAIREFIKQCHQNHKFIDMNLWAEFHGPKRLTKTNYVIGIKGLPGRPGIGSGHKMAPTLSGSTRKDYQYRKLQDWVGEDYKYYVERQQTESPPDIRVPSSEQLG